MTLALVSFVSGFSVILAPLFYMMSYFPSNVWGTFTFTSPLTVSKNTSYGSAFLASSTVIFNVSFPNCEVYNLNPCFEIGIYNPSSFDFVSLIVFTEVLEIFPDTVTFVWGL